MKEYINYKKGYISNVMVATGTNEDLKVYFLNSKKLVENIIF